MQTAFLIALLAIGQTSRPDGSFDQHAIAIDDAVISGDVEKIRSARNAAAYELLELDHAEGHYLVGFANLQLIWSGERDMTLLGGACTHLDRALELDPEYADAHLVRSMCDWMKLQGGAADPATVLQNAMQRLESAKQAAPDSFHWMMIEGMNLAYDPAGPARPEGVARIDEALDVARRVDDGQRTDWWGLNVRAWAAQIHLSEAEPNVEAARSAIVEALELRPDYAYGRTMLPQTEYVDAASVSSIERAAWRVLGSDPAGDAMNPGGADGGAFHVAHDQRSGRIWFRFDFHELPDANAFGVNVVLDTDGDPDNGVAWWGGTTDFRFDRLLTAWCTRGDDGRLRGVMGVCDAAGAKRMQLGNLVQNTLAIAVDEKADRVYVGVDASVFGASGPVRALGAVGSNVVWNDNVPDAPVRIDL